MANSPDLDRVDVSRLRREHYNAEVVGIEMVHEDLMILRVQPDWQPVEFQAGQYTVLGLGYWEPRVADTQQESLQAGQIHKVARRAYSVSCPLLDGDGQLVRATKSNDLEFYIALVRETAERAPALTPRLFALHEGDRIYVSPKFHGQYTLDLIDSRDDLVFVATGTGEAPHNVMVAELLSARHEGRIVLVTCVRYRRDLAYLCKHRELEKQFPNYRYLTLTTREPENLDASVSGFVGKRYLQDYFAAGDFEVDSGCELTAETTHVFLCGNPEMIGVPHHTHDPAQRYPVPLGMVEVLERRGFQLHRPHEEGNIHFEKYW